MMKERELPLELVDLLRVVAQQPDDVRLALADAMDAVVDSTARRRRLLGLVQEALGQIRVDMKYLMFDLTCTRRERDEAMKGEMLTKEDVGKIRGVVISAVFDSLKDVKDRDTIMENILSLIDKKSKDIGKK